MQIWCHLVYGYDPVRETITGFAVVKMAETPGLGDKILTDKGFLANFPNLGCPAVGRRGSAGQSDRDRGARQENRPVA